MKVKSTLLLFFLLTICNQLFAQIQGRVTDANSGEPISFVNVYYDGKGVGTTTDDNGEFTITAHAGWRQLTFSAVGYQTYVAQVSGNTRRVDVQLNSFELKEVVVKPKREKYSRKNNPAVEFMKKVVANKMLNDLSINDYYSYNVYERLTLSLNNITPDSLTQSKMFQRYPFFREQVEYCPDIAKDILPISVNEQVTEKIYRKDPHTEKSIIKGLNDTGINELFNTGDILTTILKDFFQKVNIYEDKVRFVQFPFDSPIGESGLGTYRYFLMDTLYVEHDKCVHLSFVPNNSRDFGFTGHLYVLADSTYRVKRAILNLPKNTGVNYVETMQIRQEFESLPSGEWVQKIDDMLCELNIFGGHFFVRRSSRNSDYSFEPIPLKILKKKGAEIKDVNAMMRDEEFWRQYRMPELTLGESNIGNFVNNLTKIKGFKYGIFILKALIENTVET
ncbi:MAG: carboxypeptidase-like regulatory domain-containing protein, partial [Bacteroidaceae bacterium]|nr:carboxypeptidase-like regulatory domain-containing protein [Bacteroidaceae bacterium]